MGIEPTSQAWEARILPMNYARKESHKCGFRCFTNLFFIGIVIIIHSRDTFRKAAKYFIGNRSGNLS